jgi:elongation factor P
MISVQELRKGMAFKFEGDLWTVMSMQHVTPGKGSAFVYVRMRSMSTGKSKENNFKSGEKIENVDIFEKKCTYLYQEADELVFMDNETYEQFHVATELCEDVIKYVILNGEVTASFYEGKVLTVVPPNFAVLKVTEADTAVKGDTATRASKYAVLETGHKILVPLFINEGDNLKIDTRTDEYLERVKV